MSFPRYPKYKPSGVEWLGEVPEHWTVLPVHRLIRTGRRITYGIVQPGERDESGRFMVRGQDYSFGWASPETLFRVSDAIESPYKRARLLAGDIVMTIVGAGVGNVATVPPWLDGANITQTTARLSVDPERADPRFISAVFQSSVGRRSIELFAKGAAQPGLNLEHVRVFPVTVPPRDEQTKIASFLDRETSKIDGLVGEQRRLIELLKEKRQAVISHAVTKGLNPHAPLKPSGIEWLGDVPEHWEVKPMRMIANVVRGASPRPAGDPLYFGGDAVPWVTVAEITKDDLVDLTETETLLTEEGAKNSKLFLKGTVIYSNSGATLGVPKILQIDACANDGVVAFEKLSREVHPQFLYRYLASITDAIREKVKQGSGQPNLNTDIVKALRFGLPPMDEQERIVGHIAKLTDQFDALTAEAERGIELLQERRTALISAAVTGQIDVRGLAETEVV